MLIRAKRTFQLLLAALIVSFWIILHKLTSFMASERKVHFVRHAESMFNEIHHRNLNLPAPRDLSLIDATLSATGKLQAEKAKDEVAQLHVDIAITSPFQRAIETCLIIHGDENVLVAPLCQERFESVCDIGSTKTQLVKKYPSLDFSELQNDIWWYVGVSGSPVKNISTVEQVIKLWQSKEDTTESAEHLKARAEKFYQFLIERPENNILVVSHSHFLKRFLEWQFGCKNDVIRNAEVLSYTLPAKDNN